MNQKIAIDFIEKQDWLGEAGDAIQPVVIKAFEAGGETGQKIKNFLHGTWLGHPLHPVITDVPIGAWTVAAVLDGLELAGKNKYKAGADAAIALGLAGAVGSAVTGLTDWTGTTKKKRKIGLLHGILNLSATALYATSLVLRNCKGSRNRAITLAMLGYGVTGIAAYLGGHLVYSEQLGVDHTATSEEYPMEFVVVLPENELIENKMRCVKAGAIPVLLVRENGNIFAIANTCSHLGGPLSEGELLDDCRVKCPWHGSVFSMQDGSVVDGPATESQPKFDVRINNGQIEVRRAK
ncbi:Rieske 2Fe-2S domain-containing protein [Mucilaginibacter flavidus]|uniref:Rieske 2Fe-2S domain-containing protein n=1 Tax=Mucilaginibacter flavidus TaxID=2949309 RepID=UPI00209216E4|nr:Rieske 2Fe-2S domain-containing protein [Mucilaginibacter flavidus]MCO5948602.1 Rieske 2Fe-2S domain-containing protein [Mucilaginibacter flavidus]